MDRDQTTLILSALSTGVDPLTGQPLPDGSPCRHPDVLQALADALHRVESCSPAPDRRKAERAANLGKPWSADEDTRLAAGFDAGATIEALAAGHGRSRLAVEIRLARLGRLPAPPAARYPIGPSVPPRAEEPAAARYVIAA